MDKKRLAVKIFEKLGYRVHRIGGDQKYSWNCPYLTHTYTPCFEDWFQRIYNEVKDFTSITEDRCYIIYKFSQYASKLNGDFAECGVYRGGSALLISKVITENQNRKNLYIFDTFEGMPSSANEDPSNYMEGALSETSLEEVKKLLEPFSFVKIHPGIIPKTFEGLEDKKFSFVHIDVDIYQSTKDCLEFFYDRISKGGIIIFDDYGWQGLEKSERRAVDEFFSDRPEEPISLRTGQAFVIKI